MWESSAGRERQKEEGRAADLEGKCAGGCKGLAACCGIGAWHGPRAILPRQVDCPVLDLHEIKDPSEMQKP